MTAYRRGQNRLFSYSVNFRNYYFQMHMYIYTVIRLCFIKHRSSVMCNTYKLILPNKLRKVDRDVMPRPYCEK